jgi:hypothetical protein
MYRPTKGQGTAGRARPAVPRDGEAARRLRLPVHPDEPDRIQPGGAVPDGGGGRNRYPRAANARPLLAVYGVPGRALSQPLTTGSLAEADGLRQVCRQDRQPHAESREELERALAEPPI